MADPARYDGVVFAPSSKYGLFPGEDDQVLLWHHGVAAPLHGVPAGWQDADYVDLRAIFHEEGYLEVEEIRLSHVRKWRIRASAVAIMLVAGLTLWRFRLDWRRGVLEVR